MEATWTKEATVACVNGGGDRWTAAAVAWTESSRTHG
jgi:hypothetical protein